MNTLTILGTLHDILLSNPHYGLKEFTSAIEQFKPDVIFTEARVEFPKMADACIDGGIEQAIVYAYATQNNIRVIATDWFDDKFIEEMILEGSDLPPEKLTHLQNKMRNYQSLFFKSDLGILHSSECQDQVQKIYAEYEKLGLLSSKKRNSHILKNIKSELAKLDGKRILVIYGMDHKYYLDHNLTDQVELMAVNDWYDKTAAEKFRFSEELKYKTICNLEESKSTLMERLQNSTVSSVYAEKLKAKLPRFDIWISHLKDM